MKKYFTLGFLALCVMVSLPVSATAAKTVSQQFDSAEMVFLPLQGKSDAYVLSNNDFYTTEFPGNSDEWTKTGKTLPLESNRMYDIIDEAAVGVSWNGFTYFVLQTAENPPADDPMNVQWDKTEVFRVEQRTGKVERVARMDAVPNYTGVKEFFQFKDALYLLDNYARFMKSTDGKTWEEIEMSGIGEDIPVGTVADYDIAHNKKYLFVSTGGYGLTPRIYRSKNGTSFKEMKGEYQDEVGSVQDMTLFNGVVYAIVTDLQGSQSVLWKSPLTENAWEKTMTTDKQLSMIDHTDTALYLVKRDFTAASDEDTTTILKSTHGKKFSKVYSGKTVDGNVLNENLIKRYAKPMFIMMSTAEEMVGEMSNSSQQSYLLRVQ